MLGALFRTKQDELLEQIVSDYGLEWTESNLNHIWGSTHPCWWFGRSNTVQFGVRETGRSWEITVGKIPSTIDIELTRVERCCRHEPTIAIEDHVPAGHELALRFRITMAGVADERFLGRQLGVAAVREPLGGMSERVLRLGIHRTGIELELERARLTRSEFDRDLIRAVEATGALERYAGANPPTPVTA